MSTTNKPALLSLEVIEKIAAQDDLVRAIVDSRRGQKPRKFDWDEDTEAFQSMVDDLRDRSPVEMSRRQATKMLNLVAKLLDENDLVVVWKDSNGNHTE